MGKFGLCCISLNLKEKGYSFNKLTYTKFNSLERKVALDVLGKRIYNNLSVTEKTIEYCFENDLSYRVSSDLFPLITYDQANVNLEDLPNYDQIENKLDEIKNTIKRTKVRISCHPSEYNVLASSNLASVDKTIKELNFYSRFFDRIGCEVNHYNPMNLHINNKEYSDEIIDRFLNNFEKLDSNCQSRLVIENDDKINCWSVKKLIYFNKRTNLPITFDYLHHKCNSDGFDEESAIKFCFSTWQKTKPIFHYSESKQGNNPRAHADYAKNYFETYGLDFDVDFELKQKDLAIQEYKKIYPIQTINQDEELCKI